MTEHTEPKLSDTGERMIPTAQGETSVVFSRHRFTYEYARQYVRDKEVLDVGCGTGYGCEILSGPALRVHGIDHDAEAVAYCRRHYGAPDVTFEQADATGLAHEDAFDAAVSFQVIEHIRDTDDFVRRLKQAVRHGGTILITTPNVKKPLDEAERNPFHFSEMNVAAFTALMARHFEDFKIVGIGYPSPNWLRSFVTRLPFYRRLGLLLRRGSAIKQVAAKAMDATRFGVLEDRIDTDAIDLLAICTNGKAAGERRAAG